MRITIVMAIYNGETFIAEQLDSIRQQTVAPDEVILADDRSTDGTAALVQAYIDKYQLNNQWHLYINEKNLGYGNNFHHAAEHATGDYIFFSDQDDIWKLDKIEIMLRIMEQHPDCSVLASDYVPYLYGEHAQTVPAAVKKKMPDNGVLEKIVFSRKSIYIGALGCCMCVRSAFYRDIQEYWYDSWAQDDRMWKLAVVSNSCYLLHSNLILHRIHGSNTATFNKNHTVEKRVLIYTKLSCAAQQAMRYTSNDLVRKQLEKQYKMFQFRIGLLQDRKFSNCIRLLRYLSYYDHPKAYLMDLVIAMRVKK